MASTRSSAVDRYGFRHDPEGRRRRARRIVAALSDFGGLDVATARLLDVGCSAGLIANELAQHAAFVAGVDIDAESLGFAAGEGGRAQFVQASGDRLPFADRAFDAVVCNHVYEHVGDPHALLAEIHRVLRPGGLCYFAAGHRLQLIEPHHRLPLLSLLPRGAASAWLRATGRGDRYDEHFLPPWKLRGLLSGFAAVEFIAPRMLREPVRYGFPGLARLPRAAHLAAGAAARAAPTWIYLLRR